MYRISIIHFLLSLICFSSGQAQSCQEVIRNLKAQIADLEESHILVNERNITLRLEREQLYNKIQYLEQELLQYENKQTLLNHSSSMNFDHPKINSPKVSRQRKIISTPVDNIKLIEKEKIADLRLVIKDELSKMPSRLAKKINLFNNQFDTYVIDLRASQQVIKFLWKDNDGKNYSSLGNVAQTYNTLDSNLIFATNGGMYNSYQQPQGLLIQNGITTAEIDQNKNGQGNFYLMPNGIFLINKQGKAKIVTTGSFIQNKMKSNTLHATQSGPMLLINGNIHSGFNPVSNNRRLRNGVGVIDENRIVFAISRERVTFYEFARLFKEVFNCKNALFLDGSISKMYCPELQRFDNKGEFGTIISLVKD